MERNKRDISSIGPYEQVTVTQANELVTEVYLADRTLRGVHEQVMDMGFEMAQEIVTEDLNSNVKVNPCPPGPERKEVDGRIKDIFGPEGENPVYIKDIPPSREITIPTQETPEPIIKLATPTDQRAPISYSEVREPRKPF